MRDKSICHRTNWLKKLKNRGLVPEMVLIEEIHGAWPWQEAERFWIAYAKQNEWSLVNSTSGGDGVPDLPEETRKRLSQVWVGRHHTEETKRKIGLASRQRRHSTETRKRMSSAQKGRLITWGDKLSKALRKITPDLVKEIKQRLNSGERVKKLAEEYGVHRTTISKIKKGVYYERYRH